MDICHFFILPLYLLLLAKSKDDSLLFPILKPPNCKVQSFVPILLQNSELLSFCYYKTCNFVYGKVQIKGISSTSSSWTYPKLDFYISELSRNRNINFENESDFFFLNEFLIKVLNIKGWFDSWFVHDVDSLDDLTLIVYIA